MPVVRKACPADIRQIVEIYQRILTKEENEGTATGWIRGVYPTEQTALQALKDQELFVMTEGEQVVAAAKINQTQVPEYKDALWSCPDAPPQQVMVLHTLTVDPDCAGKGYGSAFVKFYEEYAFAQGCPFLRMDTNAKNTAARSLYQSLGYREAGIVPCTFEGIPGVQLVCLEKKLTDNSI